MSRYIAILIAPLTPAVLLVAVPAIFTLSWPFNEKDYIIIASVAVIFGYFGLFTIGLPLAYWLKRINRLSLLNLSIGGALGGILVFYIFGMLLGLFLNPLSFVDLKSIIWGAGLGLSVSLVYGALSGITNRPT